MLDTIKVNDKTLPWLIVERGFEIPSFNFEIETEEILGRPGSIVKNRRLKEYRFELPLIIRNDYLSPGGMKKLDDVLNEVVKFLIMIKRLNYNSHLKIGIGMLTLKGQLN